MHILFAILAVISGLSSLASAIGNAAVINNCDRSVYLWVIDPAVGQEIILEPHSSYIEMIRPSPGGIEFKITEIPHGLFSNSPRLIFTYDMNYGEVWYGLCNLFGDPFEGDEVAVIPINPTGHSCDVLRWPNGLPPGGQTPATMCGENTDLHLNLCGSPPGQP
ncbi:hypothetical protein TMatcc_010062 [Talaromyces marneffei ATCC 18224]|uniref:BYS1 domain protein n=1 Tax=Talaromyces marneffei (strain ATCC 18224 / CBS 334.59 / QM 7333) TaxID=441960 RepID=B6QUA0_TALMQ|nr:conserved hypothetical protein [Talaromyces marneffei ATCC 18224]